MSKVLLAPVVRGTPLIIGYGNVLRSDDGLGPRVAQWVADQSWSGVRALAVPQLTPELADALADASQVVFVDAWQTDEENLQVQPLQPENKAGSLGHTSDPGSLLALAQALYNRCPAAWLIRVPAVNFAFGKELSPLAARGTDAARKEIIRLLTGSPPD